jgi:hypothetical protein
MKNAIALWLMLLCFPALAGSSVDAVKGVEGFSFKRGLFLTGDVGLFTAVGGYKDGANAQDRKARTFSNIQPFVGLTVGYDVLDFLALGLKFGQGYISGAARSKDNVESPTDFALAFVDAAVMASVKFYERVIFTGSIFGGLAVMTPPVLPDAQRYGGHLGASIGLRYDTLLNGMIVGIDFGGHMSFLPKTGIGSVPGIVALSLTPLIKYVF